jgi:DNA-binding beta-propeller fold protein YncE
VDATRGLGPAVGGAGWWHRLRQLGALGGLVLLAGAPLPAPAAGAASLAYLGRSRIDTASLSVAATVPVEVEAVDPKGARAFGLTDDGRVGILDTLSDSVVAEISPGFAVTGLAVALSGERLYVTGTAVADGSLSSATLLVVDTGTGAEMARVDLGLAQRVSRPLVHPAGTAVYVFHDRAVAVVDADTNALAATIPLPDAIGPGGFGGPFIHPSGHFIYASVDPIGSSRALVIDTRLNAVARVVAMPNSSFLGAILADGPDDARLFAFGTNIIGSALALSAAVFDAGTGGLLATIPLGARAGSAAADQVGRAVYVSLFQCVGSSCGLRPSAGVAVIDGDALALVSTLPAGTDDPGQSLLSLDPGALRVYVRGATRLSVIDAQTRSLVTTVPFFPEPRGGSLPVGRGLGFVFAPGRVARPGWLVFYRLGSAGSETAVQWGAPGDVPLSGDHDGDGRTDLALWRPRQGEIEGIWFIQRSSDGASVAFQWGAAATGDQPVPADYDGDGRADLAVWRRVEGSSAGGGEEGVWYVVRSSDRQALRQQWGAANDRPVPADYDGDGRADLAVWRAGTWYIIGSRDGSVRTEQLGEATDVPVPADYDGDGRADLAVWRPATGEWVIVSSRDGTVTHRQWGGPGDVPVPADHDGDGRADRAVWRARTGEWWVLGSRDGAVTRRQWGAEQDTPLRGDYDGDGLADFTVYRQ